MKIPHILMDSLLHRAQRFLKSSLDQLKWKWRRTLQLICWSKGMWRLRCLSLLQEINTITSILKA